MQSQCHFLLILIPFPKSHPLLLHYSHFLLSPTFLLQQVFHCRLCLQDGGDGNKILPGFKHNQSL